MWEITATSHNDTLDSLEDFLRNNIYDGDIVSLTATIARGVRFEIRGRPGMPLFAFDIFNSPVAVRSEGRDISIECKFDALKDVKSVAEVIVELAKENITRVRLHDTDRCERLKILVDNMAEIKDTIQRHEMDVVGGYLCSHIASDMLIKLLDAYCTP